MKCCVKKAIWTRGFILIMAKKLAKPNFGKYIHANSSLVLEQKQQSMQTWFSWIDFSSLAIWYRHKVSSMYTRRGRCFCKCMNHTRIVQVAPYLSLKVIVLWNSILFTRIQHNIEIHIVRSTHFIFLKSCAINIVQFLKFNGRPISHPIRKGTIEKSILAVHLKLIS